LAGRIFPPWDPGGCNLGHFEASPIHPPKGIFVFTIAESFSSCEIFMMGQKLKFIEQPKTVSVSDITPLSYLFLFYDTFVDCWVSFQVGPNFFHSCGFLPHTSFDCTVADKLGVSIADVLVSVVFF
jgi:hypothetical protein